MINKKKINCSQIYMLNSDIVRYKLIYYQISFIRGFGVLGFWGFGEGVALRVARRVVFGLLLEKGLLLGLRLG